MADNIAVTAGTGTTVAADEVADGTLGTVKVQYVKLMDGTLDGTTKAAVGANGLAVSATVAAALPAGTNVIGHVIADSGSTTAVTQATASSLLASVGGLAASGASVSGNPLLSGARAATTNPTAVTDGQAVALMASKTGKLVVVGAPRDLVATQKTSISASTSETTIVTAIASTFADILSFTFANSGSTATKVDIRDTTGGSIIATFFVPATDMRGAVYHVPLAQTTVNTNWTAQCSASTTALEVTVQYVKTV